MNKVSEKSLVLITGGAGHIGMACARHFADHRILITDLVEEAVEGAVKKLQDEGLQVSGVAADITRKDDANELASIASKIGQFSVLIHAAGVAPPTPVATIYAVNLFGTINVLDAFEPLVKTGVAGVCIASMAGHRTLGHRFDHLLIEPEDEPAALALRIESDAPTTPKHRLAYAVSKRGTILQVQRRAYAWGQRGGRLLSVSPGILGDTEMGAQRQAGLNQQGKDFPVGRLGTSDEIAHVVRFAASTGASLMTGTDLLVDGGNLAYCNHRFDPSVGASWHALEF